MEHKIFAIRSESVRANQFIGEGRNLVSRVAADRLRPHIAHAIFSDGIQKTLSIVGKDWRVRQVRIGVDQPSD